MTEPPAGTPWWAWLIGVAIVVVIPVALTHLGQRPVRRGLAEQAVAVEAVRGEVQNDHSTNLREDMDIITERLSLMAVSVTTVSESVAVVAQRSGELSKSVGGIRDDLRQERADRAAGDKQLVDVAERLRDLERRIT